MDYARLRIALNRAKAYGTGGPVQLFAWHTNQTPVLGWGRALQIELGIFAGTVGGELGVLDTSGLTSITAQLRVAVGGVIDIAAADVFNRSTGVLYTISQDQWDNDTPSPSYHAAIAFSATEMGALVGLTFDSSNNTAPAALVFSATTAQGLVPLGAGLVTIYKDGGTGPGSGTAPTAVYTLTNDQINGMVNSRLAAGENPPAVGYTLRGANGWGMSFSIDDSSGTPVLVTTPLPPLP